MHSTTIPNLLLPCPVFRSHLARRHVSRLRQQQRRSRDEEWAALVLQRYFRMWHAQARLTRLQMDQETSDSERIVFTDKVQLVRLSVLA